MQPADTPAEMTSSDRSLDRTAPDPTPSGPSGSLGGALGRFLHPAPAERSVGAIVRWWERRRLAFNGIVAAGAAVSLTGHGVMNWLQGFAGIEQLLALLPVLVVANVCYCLGPLTESALHKLWGRDVAPVGPHLLRAGLALSVGVTFVLPMLALGVRAVVAAVGAVLGLGG